LSRTLDVLESIWNEGAIRQNGIPGDAADQARLQRLLAAMVEAQTLILTLAAERRPPLSPSRGIVFEGLRKLQTKLGHIQEVVAQVADGNFSRRIESNGEFGSAFNEMIRSMEDTRHRLRRRDAELFEINSRLHAEVDVRIKAQEELELANTTLQSQILEIQCLQAKLREQAIRDALTGLFNRRYLEETLERELAAASRTLSSLSIILLDLDHFKEFNDQYGHAAGDTVLRILSTLLRGNTRSSDIACRYGGEEFIVVLPGAGIDLACERGEYLRMIFEQSEIIYGGMAMKATLSAGISSFPAHGSTADELIRAADTALYDAKRNGRNQVVIAGCSPAQPSLPLTP
jgi:diguanylate cyclase (GGDEF)-like protein